MGYKQDESFAVCTTDGCYAIFPLREKLDGIDECIKHRGDA